MTRYVRLWGLRFICVVLVAVLVGSGLLEARKFSEHSSSASDLHGLLSQVKQKAQMGMHPWATQLLPQLQEIYRLLAIKACVKIIRSALLAAADNIAELQQQYSDPGLDAIADWVAYYKPDASGRQWKKNALIAAVALVAAGVAGVAAVRRSRINDSNKGSKVGPDENFSLVGSEAGAHTGEDGVGVVSLMPVAESAELVRANQVVNNAVLGWVVKTRRTRARAAAKPRADDAARVAVQRAEQAERVVREARANHVRSGFVSYWIGKTRRKKVKDAREAAAAQRVEEEAAAKRRADEEAAHARILRDMAAKRQQDDAEDERIAEQKARLVAEAQRKADAAVRLVPFDRRVTPEERRRAQAEEDLRSLIVAGQEKITGLVSGATAGAGHAGPAHNTAIENHLRHISFMLDEVNKNPEIISEIEVVRSTAWARRGVHIAHRASGLTEGVQKRDGREYEVVVDSKKLRLKHKAVENYLDHTCVGHSMAQAVLGYPYQGASIALCLALNAYSFTILVDLLKTIQGTKVVEFTSTLQALADWSSRPVYIWQWGRNAYPTSDQTPFGADQTRALHPYTYEPASIIRPKRGFVSSAEDAIHLFYVKWIEGGAHCEVLFQEKFWDLHNLAALNWMIFEKAREAIVPLLCKGKNHLSAGSLSLRQYIEVYIQSLACASGIDQQQTMSAYLRELARVCPDEYRKLQTAIQDIIALLIVSVDMLYERSIIALGLDSTLPLFKDALLWEGTSKAYKWLSLLDNDYQQACLGQIWEKSLAAVVGKPYPSSHADSYYYDAGGVVYRRGRYSWSYTGNNFPLWALLYYGAASGKLSISSGGGSAVVPGMGANLYGVSAGAGSGVRHEGGVSELCLLEKQEEIVSSAVLRDFLSLLAATTHIAIVVHTQKAPGSLVLESAWWGDKKNKSVNLLLTQSKGSIQLTHLWDCSNGYRLLTEKYADAEKKLDDWYDSQSKVDIINKAQDLGPYAVGVLLHGNKLINSSAYWSLGTNDGSVELQQNERLWFLTKSNGVYSLLAIGVKPRSRYSFAVEDDVFVLMSSTDSSMGILADSTSTKYYLGRYIAVIPSLDTPDAVIPKGLLYNDSYINAEQLQVVLDAVENEELRDTLVTYFGGGDLSSGAVEVPKKSDWTRFLLHEV